jgi:hypothetical protein
MNFCYRSLDDDAEFGNKTKLLLASDDGHEMFRLARDGIDRSMQ